jgi:hypothetical protein
MHVTSMGGHHLWHIMFRSIVSEAQDIYHYYKKTSNGELILA